MSQPRRVDIVRSFRAGQAAKAAKRDVTSIPYDVNSTDRVEKLRIMAWLRGWRLGQLTSGRH